MTAAHQSHPFVFLLLRLHISRSPLKISLAGSVKETENFQCCCDKRYFLFPSNKSLDHKNPKNSLLFKAFKNFQWCSLVLQLKRCNILFVDRYQVHYFRHRLSCVSGAGNHFIWREGCVSIRESLPSRFFFQKITQKTDPTRWCRRQTLAWITETDRYFRSTQTRMAKTAIICCAPGWALINVW